MLSSPPRLGGLAIPPFWHARLQWYHWFQATERGAQAVREDGKGFARIMWETWSPKGWFEGDTFDPVAVTFENPDWVDIRFRMPATDAHIGQLGLQDFHRNDHH